MASKPYALGYVTATCDIVHQGHFAMLQRAKQLCNILWVGLTTDETAAKQKRPVTHPYAERAAVLEHCRHVDMVLPHKGEPKSVAWKRYRFDVCFTCAQEYFDAEEFDELRRECPNVAIVGLPRTDAISSTAILARLHLQSLQSLRVLTYGVTGPLLQLGQWILKPLHFAHEDTLSLAADNFGFFHPRRNEDSDAHTVALPRQYKHLGEEGLFPNIAGIAPGREILLNRFFKGRDWCAFEADKVGQEFPSPSCEQKLVAKEDETHQAFAARVATARLYPRQVHWLVMRDAGITLHEFVRRGATPGAFVGVCERVREVLLELRQMGVLHGDVHARNVLVEPHTHRVTLIDWGWSSAHLFPLSAQERHWLDGCLQENWDWSHFLGSLRTDDVCRPLCQHLPNPTATLVALPAAPPPPLLLTH